MGSSCGALVGIPISSDVTSPFPPSGNEGYIRNHEVFLCGSLVFKELIKYFNANQFFTSNNLLMWQVALQ